MARVKMMRNVGPAIVGPTLVAFAMLATTAPSCAPAEERIVVLAGDDSTGSFVDDDASADTSVAAQPDGATVLTEYCPSNKCPAGRATCLSSQFLCDVNLQTDSTNCGECERPCNGPSSNESASYVCTGGRCVLACRNPPYNIDCNGLAEDGCETKSTTNENCGACGVQCLDPAKPCLQTDGQFRCGCPQGMILCPDGTGASKCIDPNTDDANCGTCQNACDPGGDGGTPPPHAAFGCIGGRCREPKCEPDFQNCDQDWTNGCEVWIRSNDNCGSCGNVCSPGLECKGNKARTPTCSCPANSVYCERWGVDIGDTHLSYAGECADFGSSREHCGGCFRACPVGSYSKSICDFGLCKRICNTGRADCNGSEADDCEVNTDSDPSNCGGCGIECDAIAGQACVGGRCMVEPCPAAIEDGGIPR